MFTVEVVSEAKNLFFKKEIINEDGEKEMKRGMMRHSTSHIVISLNNKPEVVFKMTRRGGHYDSRDKKGKSTTAEEVQKELCRMLGDIEGMKVYHEAKRAMMSAMPR